MALWKGPEEQPTGYVVGQTWHLFNKADQQPRSNNDDPQPKLTQYPQRRWTSPNIGFAFAVSLSTFIIISIDLESLKQSRHDNYVPTRRRLGLPAIGHTVHILLLGKHA